MASQEKLECLTSVRNIQFGQKFNPTRAKFLCECGKERSNGSSKSVELEGLKKDLSELTHLFHTAKRPTVKEVIQLDMDLILAKIESLKDIFREQCETKVSWTKVAAIKHKKNNYKERRITDPFPVISNRYNLLCNDSYGDDTAGSTARLRVINSKNVNKDKVNHKKRMLEKKPHKVVILGDSHARGCAAKVKQLLNNDFEVVRYVNPGSGMKFIKDTAKVKTQQLTKKDVVVLWGDSNDITRNNSIVGMKHILEFVINANQTNVIPKSVPHRHDLIRNSCVNNEVEAFNRRLSERLQRFENVKMIDVVSERDCYTKHGQHLNSGGRESMSKKITATIECMLNKKVDPISMKWYNDEVTGNQEYQALQGKAGNHSEEENSECSGTSSVLDISRVQDSNHNFVSDNILDTVNNESLKRPRRLPVTRNKDILCTKISRK
jgi:hypothetical protein